MITSALERREALSLARLAGCGGCAAKFAPDDLVHVVGEACSDILPPGVTAGDDAAVFGLDSDRALIASLDFFPPLFDSPEDYGRVAAANAVSDIYAMGGKLAFALAILGLPRHVPTETAARISRAARQVVEGCGGWMLGGHSVHCAEPIFGLAVQGFVHPGSVWRKSGAEPGDALVLSKPLGTGILISSGDRTACDLALATMVQTNQEAADSLRAARSPKAVTDVTGFGLLGHAAEMAQHSAVRLKIDSHRVPLIPAALDWAREGVRTSADRTNRRSFQKHVSVDGSVAASVAALLFDPQTSGGLLAAIDPRDIETTTSREFVQIGTVEAGAAEVVVT